jgi:hypothetical protein
MTYNNRNVNKDFLLWLAGLNYGSIIDPERARCDSAGELLRSIELLNAHALQSPLMTPSVCHCIELTRFQANDVWDSGHVMVHHYNVLLEAINSD